MSAGPASTGDRPERGAGALLAVERVSLCAGGRTLVDDLGFGLSAGENLALVGPNGSGKSTLLAALAGLLRPDTGAIRRPATPPGMLFQDGALWPHLDVEGHLAFVDRGADPGWRARLIEDFALAGLRRARPAALSGGERVRLGLARAFAGRPAWVLLDEPLAHVDARWADRIRALVPALVEELGAASVVVVHEAGDLWLFGSRLLCLSGEGGWWLGRAGEALAEPPTPLLAALSGRGTLLSGIADDAGQVELGLGFGLSGRRPGETVTTFLAAAQVRVQVAGSTLPTDGPGGSLSGTWVGPEPRGGGWVRVGRQLLRCAAPPTALRPGDRVSLAVEGTPRELDASGSRAGGREAT